jgi:FkbM family methyltransferase
VSSEKNYNWRSIRKKNYTRFYEQFFGKGDTVFDIGANDGSISSFCLNLGAKVVALAPHPDHVNTLRQTLGANKRFFLLPNAISSFKAEIILTADEITTTILAKHYDEWELNRAFIDSAPTTTLVSETPLTIKVITLDYMVEQFGLPVFCRIETDGEETEVLRGLNYTIPVLAFNFHSYNPKRTTELIRRLLVLGDYEFNWCEEYTLQFRSDTWLSAKELNTSITESQGKHLTGDIYARLKNFFPVG